MSEPGDTIVLCDNHTDAWATPSSFTRMAR